MQVVCNQEPCGDPISSSSKISKVSLNSHHFVSLNNGIYTIHFSNPGNYEVFAINSIGQVMAHRSTNGVADIQFNRLPKGKYFFKVNTQ
jgi:arabinan endo-1,5-alpha-L-arabinosidase